MAVSEAGLDIPAVSLPNGAASLPPEVWRYGSYSEIWVILGDLSIIAGGMEIWVILSYSEIWVILGDISV